MVSKTRANPHHGHHAFAPALVLVVGIFNKAYGNTKCANLEEVEGDAGRVIEFLKVLKIPEKNIDVLRDATYDQVDECWDKLKKLYNNAKKGPPTLFVIWYGGHGEMGG